MRSPHLGSGLLALVLTAVAFVPGAHADPAGDPATPDTPSATDVQAAEDRAGDALADVERVQQQLDAATAEADAANVRAAHAAEAWNGARWRAAEARRAERRAVRVSAQAEQARKAQQAEYRDVVIAASHGNLDLNAVNAIITAEGMDSLLDRVAANDHIQALFDQQRDEYAALADAARKAAAAADRASDQADSALADAATARDAAAAAAARAAATEDATERRRARLVRRLARLQGISVQLAEQRQAALGAARAADRERASAAAAAQATAATAAAPATDSAPDPARDEDPAPQPAPKEQAPKSAAPAVVPDAPEADNGGAEKAIAFARAQLGERYEWGADGPDSWDCSGLTAKAWAAGGKSLPHYSVAQYEQSTPISAAQLRPGDLVFWSDGGPGAIFHVALYTGGGRIIHAPRTGRPVTEESMYYWRSPDYFARP